MNLACVILAAGEGRRMGLRNKALLSWKGQTFLQRIAELCRGGGVSEVVVVVAEPHGVDTAKAAASLGLATVHNPHPEKGMASSVGVGFAYARSHFQSEACWLWPVDSPGIGPSTLAQVAALGDSAEIITPRFGGRGGHPSLIGRDIWAELADCEKEPEGARSVLRRDPERRRYVDVEDALVRHDVDRPQDLEGVPC